MERYELIAPCHFGMEAVLKREIYDLGYDIEQVEDGKVTFVGDAEAICRANVFLRSTERVLLKVAKFKAVTFDELFEKTKAIEWENYLPKDAKFWVAKATSIKSKLFSPSDIQSIIKKAIVERLKSVYKISWFEESGEAYPIRVSFMKDEITIALDTSGDSLHKRGYRKLAGKAPITETLASAIIMLSPWNKDRILVDPFCGSGTIPIEAAMIGANIAPGLNREFSADKWTNLIPKQLWYDTVEEAQDLIDRKVEMTIQGYDIDPEMVKVARANAKLAGVEKHIHFQARPLAELSHNKKYGFIITNPPYGERLEDKKDMPKLYKQIGERYRNLDSWSAFIITGYEDAQKHIGRKADKNRKIYNGMMKTYLYQYMGPRPPKRTQGTEE
ncbi:MAG: class I SAM-dependent RNA methyltransferase [Lachnospiraceae bacterium]|nr:class I SAM-dependent RNA methyltransferase [Lachnospiraceae bacterium]